MKKGLILTTIMVLGLSTSLLAKEENNRKNENFLKTKEKILNNINQTKNCVENSIDEASLKECKMKAKQEREIAREERREKLEKKYGKTF